MIKEALQYVIGLGNTRIEKVDSQVFSTQKIYEVEEATASSLRVRSLSGLVEYIKSNFDDHDKRGNGRLMIHVLDPTTVKCFTTFNRDLARNWLIEANAKLPEFYFDKFYNTETFNIKLQSAFVGNDDRDIMLQVVGNIKEEQVANVGDDGISQAVTAKTGVATVSTVKVPNPVVLKPYRTFVEVDQPESDFVFRMKTGPSCALFEADGGAWELEAMKNIKNYLTTELDDLVGNGTVVVIA